MTVHNQQLQRDYILRVLSEQKRELFARYGVTRLGVFGSVARDQASEGSDIDIVVEMPPDLFQMVHLKEELETLLGMPVDLIRLHRHMNSSLRNRIDEEAIYL